MEARPAPLPPLPPRDPGAPALPAGERPGSETREVRVRAGGAERTLTLAQLEALRTAGR